MRGVKNDDRKLRWSLLPPGPLEDIVRVLSFGAKKYSPDNWLFVGDGERRYLDAALRHINAYRKGSKKDKQSNRSHISHALCCLIFLWHFEQERYKNERKTRKAVKKNSVR
jgi:hypothetical protein